MLGLEYSASELVNGMRRSWQGGVLDLVLNFLPGAALALLLGWGVVGAMVMGGVTYISSSGIAAKVITDLGRIGNRETPVVLSILVFEDLAMAMYLPILTATLAGISFLEGMLTVGISLAVVTVVLAVALRHGHHVSKAVHSENSEVFLLNLLGAALLVAGLAAALQVSAAVGAFMLGIAISGATADSATRILEPLRDLFAAIFFVAFGLNTDPASIPPVLGWALVLAVVTAATKMVTGVWAAWRAGIARPRPLPRRSCPRLPAANSRSSSPGWPWPQEQCPDELAALATAYVLIMAILGPLGCPLRGACAREVLPPGHPRSSAGLTDARLNVRAVEVQVAAACGRSALALVAVAVLAGTVGVFGGRGQPEEAELADLHARPQLDGQRGHVGQFQRHVAGETGVDEARGGVRQQAEPAQGGLALEAGRDVVRKADSLVGGAQNELARVQDERLALLHLHEAGQFGLFLGRVDMRVLVVVEQPEKAVDPDVNRGRLHHRGVVRVQDDPFGINFGTNVAVRDQHTFKNSINPPPGAPWLRPERPRAGILAQTAMPWLGTRGAGGRPGPATALS